MIRPRRAWVGPAMGSLLAAAATLSAGCDKHHAPNVPAPPVQIVVADSLVFQRADSSVVAMGETPLVCCGLYDPGFVNERAMRVVFYDPANQESGWQILILIDRAEPGDTTTLPTVVVAPSKVPHVSMFVADGGYELNSDAQDSSGTIVVHSFACTATAIQLDFSVDAVIGSEFAGGPSMRVHGTFQATFPARSCT